MAAALLDYLKKESKQWDFCGFNNMPPDPPVASCLATLLGDRGWTGYDEQIASSAISLPETWKSVSRPVFQQRAREKSRTTRTGCKENTGGVFVSVRAKLICRFAWGHCSTCTRSAGRVLEGRGVSAPMPLPLVSNGS